MMRFHWPISNWTFFWSAENESSQFSWVIFAHSVFQENWKIELAEPCTDRLPHRPKFVYHLSKKQTVLIERGTSIADLTAISAWPESLRAHVNSTSAFWDDTSVTVLQQNTCSHLSNCRSYHVVEIYRRCQTWIMTLYVIRSTISPNASLG